METPFYNTIKLQGDELIEAHENAEIQDKRVFELIRNSNRRLTANQIFEMLSDYGYPLSSIHRSLHTLTDKQFKIQKSQHPEVMGPRGRRVHTWFVVQHVN